jgi:hypothetical protein
MSRMLTFWAIAALIPSLLVPGNASARLNGFAVSHTLAVAPQSARPIALAPQNTWQSRFTAAAHSASTIGGASRLTVSGGGTPAPTVPSNPASNRSNLSPGALAVRGTAVAPSNPVSSHNPFSSNIGLPTASNASLTNTITVATPHNAGASSPANPAGTLGAVAVSPGAVASNRGTMPPGWTSYLAPAGNAVVGNSAMGHSAPSAPTGSSSVASLGGGNIATPPSPATVVGGTGWAAGSPTGHPSQISSIPAVVATNTNTPIVPPNPAVNRGSAASNYIPHDQIHPGVSTLGSSLLAPANPGQGNAIANSSRNWTSGRLTSLGQANNGVLTVTKPNPPGPTSQNVLDCKMDKAGHCINGTTDNNPDPDNNNVGVKCFFEQPSEPGLSLDPSGATCNGWDWSQTCDLTQPDEPGWDCRPNEHVTGIPSSGPDLGYRCQVGDVDFNTHPVSCKDFSYWGDNSWQACNLKAKNGLGWVCLPSPPIDMAQVCASPPNNPITLAPMAMACTGTKTMADLCAKVQSGWIGDFQNEQCPIATPVGKADYCSAAPVPFPGPLGTFTSGVAWISVCAQAKSIAEFCSYYRGGIAHRVQREVCPADSEALTL